MDTCNMYTLVKNVHSIGTSHSSFAVLMLCLLQQIKYSRKKPRPKHPCLCLYLYHLIFGQKLSGVLFQIPAHGNTHTNDAHAKQNFFFFLSLYENSYKFLACRMEQTFFWTVQHKLSIQVSLKPQSERLNSIKCCRSLMPHLCNGSGQSSFTVK